MVNGTRQPIYQLHLPPPPTGDRGELEASDAPQYLRAAERDGLRRATPPGTSERPAKPTTRRALTEYCSRQPWGWAAFASLPCSFSSEGRLSRQASQAVDARAIPESTAQGGRGATQGGYRPSGHRALGPPILSVCLSVRRCLAPLSAPAPLPAGSGGRLSKPIHPRICQVTMPGVLGCSQAHHRCRAGRRERTGRRSNDAALRLFGQTWVLHLEKARDGAFVRRGRRTRRPSAAAWLIACCGGCECGELNLAKGRHSKCNVCAAALVMP